MADEITVERFVTDPVIVDCLSRLKEKFGPNGVPFIVSDVIDEEGHQYVNLVQKGGGVLGIALVGYTFILEHMGIRFIRLAGTSAGAINTALMTVIGTKQDPKSLKILEEMCKLNFFNLVDGHPAARLLIKNFITHKNFGEKVKEWISGTFKILGILFVLAFVCFGLEHKFPSVSLLTKALFVLNGFFLLFISVIVAYGANLIYRLKESGFGINPGDFFYNWIKGIMMDNGVKTVSDLNAKASQPVPGLKLRVPNSEGLNNLEGDVTFITSELVTQNKIQFPAMSNLFRREQDIDTLSPAGFVRASMAIPLFFQSYFIEEIPCKDPEIIKAWETLGEADPPTTARFVDGGILSNFPINLFYNPRAEVPRLPSFGIDLNDTKPEDETKHVQTWSLGGYFYRMFNTIRYYYDKDFLIKNAFFKKGIGTIKLIEFNWLNFFLKPQDKLKMLQLGAQAATDFLIKFNWEDYKKDRDAMRSKLDIQASAVNTKTQPTGPKPTTSPVLSSI